MTDICSVAQQHNIPFVLSKKMFKSRDNKRYFWRIQIQNPLNYRQNPFRQYHLGTRYDLFKSSSEHAESRMRELNNRINQTIEILKFVEQSNSQFSKRIGNKTAFLYMEDESLIVDLIRKFGSKILEVSGPGSIDIQNVFLKNPNAIRRNQLYFGNTFVISAELRQIGRAHV